MPCSVAEELALPHPDSSIFPFSLSFGEIPRNISFGVLKVRRVLFVVGFDRVEEWFCVSVWIKLSFILNVRNLEILRLFCSLSFGEIPRICFGVGIEGCCLLLVLTGSRNGFVLLLLLLRRPDSK